MGLMQSLTGSAASRNVHRSEDEGKFVGWMPPRPNTGEGVVLIPVDESRQAEEAFEWYLEHMHLPANKVRIIHCIDIQFTSNYLPDLKAQPFEEELYQKRKRCDEIVKKYNRKLIENSVQGSVQTYMGKPGETIIEYAIATESSHIIIGSRGFGLLRQTILGSVSEFVLNHSKVPVTVVPKMSKNAFF